MVFKFSYYFIFLKIVDSAIVILFNFNLFRIIEFYCHLISCNIHQVVHIMKFDRTSKEIFLFNLQDRIIFNKAKLFIVLGSIIERHEEEPFVHSFRSYLYTFKINWLRKYFSVFLREFKLLQVLKLLESLRH
jgi:hypothetical protein